MRYFKSTVVLVLLAFCLTAKAGVAALTFHSRANCAGFNESISWHLTSTYWLQTYSEHFSNINNSVPDHTLDSGTEDTWRSAAIHMTEGYGGWKVIGRHYLWDGRKWLLKAITQVTDCSIYDGWWEY